MTKKKALKKASKKKVSPRKPAGKWPSYMTPTLPARGWPAVLDLSKAKWESISPGDENDQRLHVPGGIRLMVGSGQSCGFHVEALPVMRAKDAPSVLVGIGPVAEAQFNDLCNRDPGLRPIPVQIKGQDYVLDLIPFS